MIIGYRFQPDGTLVGYDESMQDLVEDLLPASDPTVQTALLGRTKAEATARTVAFANKVRERIASSKHYLQAARWSIQLASAKAVKAGTATEFDTSVLGREARLRNLGESIEQLSDKVLANSLVFASVGAAVDGIERATMDAIAACTEVDQVEPLLVAAKVTARQEFLDILSPVYGASLAAARATEFFGGA